MTSSYVGQFEDRAGREDRFAGSLRRMALRIARRIESAYLKRELRRTLKRLERMDDQFLLDMGLRRADLAPETLRRIVDARR